MFNWTLVLVFACIGIFCILSSLFGLFAWLIFGPEIAKWVFWIGMSFGAAWTIYCYGESR